MATFISLAPFRNAVNLDLVKEIIRVADYEEGEVGLLFLQEGGGEVAWLEVYRATTPFDPEEDVVIEVTTDEGETWTTSRFEGDVESIVGIREKAYQKIFSGICNTHGTNLIEPRA